MNRLERLAIGRAIKKIVDQDLHDIEAELKADMQTAYEQDEPQLSRLISLNGVEVGKVSVRKSKPGVTTSLVCSDDMDIDAVDAVAFAREYAPEFAQWYRRETGMYPDGVTEQVDTDRGGQFIGITITGCRPQDVAAALQGQLASAYAGYLTGDDGHE